MSSLSDEFKSHTAGLHDAVSALVTPLVSSVRQANARSASLMSQCRLLHSMHKASVASRRAAYDQLWAHAPNGSIRVIARVVTKAQSPTVSIVKATAEPLANEIVVKERGMLRQFLFDKVHDTSVPITTALADIDALVCRNTSDVTVDYMFYNRFLLVQALSVLEGDHACVFLSSTADISAETANAAHYRALKTIFACLPSHDAFQGGESSPFRLTLSYVDVCLERAADMLSLSAAVTR